MIPKNLRGSGIKHTAPFIGRFSGIWLLVTVAAVLVASASSYLAFVAEAGSAQEIGRGLVRSLIVQTTLVLLAVVALAAFTTHRLAGPWIAVRRACQRVRDGDFDCRLEIRGRDAYLQAVAEDFNAMMDTVRERLPDASVPSSTGPPHDPAAAGGQAPSTD